MRRDVGARLIAVAEGLGFGVDGDDRDFLREIQQRLRRESARVASRLASQATMMLRPTLCPLQPGGAIKAGRPE